jgi:O-antigen ligase
MVKNRNVNTASNLILFPIFLLLSLFIAITSVYKLELAIGGIGLIVGGTAVLLLSVRWPETFLILAVWTSFMKSAYIPGLAVGEFGATPYMVFTIMAALGFSIQIITGKRHLILPTGLGFFLLFLAFTTLSLLIVQNFRLAIGVYVRNALDWILLLLLVQMLTDQKKVGKLVTALLIQAVFVVGWGLLAGAQLEILNMPRRSLFFWQQFQKNDFAAYLGIVLVLSLATVTLAKSWRTKLLALLLLAAVPIGWVFTFSRGGFLAILVCLVVFLALERNKKRLRQSFVAIVLVGLLGLGFIIFSSSEARNLALDGLRSIATGESEAERHTDTIAFRLELDKVAVKVIAEHPFLGVGFNQWQFYSPITTRVYDPQADEFRETGYSVHNRLLLIAANNGLLTLSGYIGFLVVALVYSLHVRRSANVYMRTYLHVFIAAVIGMQVALLFAPSVTWEWASLGILIGMAKVAKNDMKNFHKKIVYETI